jgi:hypothetical protein
MSAPAPRGLAAVLVCLPALLFGRLAAAQTAAPPAAPSAAPPAAPPTAPPTVVVPAAEPAVEWKAQAKGGFLFTSGNSQTTNGTFGLVASRKEGKNKLALEGMVAYGRSNVLVPVFDAAAPTTIIDLDRREIETTNMWNAKGRYDRFITENNAAFGAGLVSADKVAGKAFAGGVQAGYSRQLLKNHLHLLVAELGYDFSHERYVQQPMRMVEPISIHSGRVFVAETLKLTNDTGATASVEALFNLNREGSALNVNNGTLGVDAFKDTRVVGKLGFTTTFWKALSIGLGFTLRYDQNPAPRPIPSGSPAGSAYAAGFQPFANKTDILGEATLIYTFL